MANSLHTWQNIQRKCREAFFQGEVTALTNHILQDNVTNVNDLGWPFTQYGSGQHQLQRLLADCANEKKNGAQSCILPRSTCTNPANSRMTNRVDQIEHLFIPYSKLRLDSHLTSYTNLKQLHVRDCTGDITWLFESLVHFPKLEILNLCGAYSGNNKFGWCSDPKIPHALSTSLTHLMISEVPTWDGWLLKRLPALTHVSINRCHDVATLDCSGMPALTSLSIRDCSLLTQITVHNDVDLSELFMFNCDLFSFVDGFVTN
jgi:hypothetical protein